MKQPPVSTNATSAPLIRDIAANVAMHRFRTTDDLSKLPASLDRTGLPELRCSASSQFSEPGWAQIRRHLPEAADKTFVVDLRQESHGFLNGHAISWHADHNWGCVGLTPADALRLEELRLRVLATSEEVEIALGHEVRSKRDKPAGDGTTWRLGTNPASEAYCAAHAPVELCPTRLGRPSRHKRTHMLETTTWTVNRVASEHEVVALPEGHYVRIPVTDHLRPTDESVDKFVEVVQHLPLGAHLHFHCHGGAGRTTTFMALYDILRNATSVPLESILTRVRLLSQYCLCFVSPDFHRDYVVERWELLARFYRYARDVGPTGGRSWRAWLAEGPKGP